MKKQNRNAFAYIRQPNVHCEESSLPRKSSPNQTIYHEIIGQMDQGITNYLTKIIHKNEKDEKDNKKSLQNHERTKSYADILLDTPSSSKNPADKGYSHRGSHTSTQINNIFFSLNNSPTNQKTPSVNKPKSFLEKRESSSSFLETLDTYLQDLNVNKGDLGCVSKPSLMEENVLIERKSIQKSREKSAKNLKIIERLESSMKRQKELKIANQILANENEKMKNKLKKNKQVVKTTMQELFQYAQSLSQQLKQQKRERKKLQEFIAEFQSKFSLLRPQRKTSGAKPRLEEYLISETTEQDDSEAQNCSQIKSIKRKPVPRSTAKNSRVSGFHIEELSAMLASKNFDFDDEEDSENFDE